VADVTGIERRVRLGSIARALVGDTSGVIDLLPCRAGGAQTREVNDKFHCAGWDLQADGTWCGAGLHFARQTKGGGYYG